VSKCTCGLEPYFCVDGDRGPEGFYVMDAECTTVAVCEDYGHAELIAWALNKAAPEDNLNGPCIVHEPPPPLGAK
jgi:hypothetical protein